MRFSPPFTGDPELDDFLQQLSRYVSDLPTGVTADEGTGVVGAGNVGRLSLLYRYLHVKFATDNVGTGFSDSPTSQLYYGLHNSDSSVESGNWFDYTWYPATFGLSNQLWYKNIGGRTLQLVVSAAAPDIAYVLVTAPAIDLDQLALVLADGSVTTPKLADSVVTEIKLADNSVSKAKMQDDSVGIDELDTAGTPTTRTFLNGDMDWVEIPGGLTLPQKIMTANFVVDADTIGSHFYNAAGGYVLIEDQTLFDANLGATVTIINVSGSDAFFISKQGNVYNILTGGEDIALEVASPGKVLLIKVEPDRWVAEGNGMTLLSFDPTVSALELESSTDILETESTDTIITES